MIICSELVHGHVTFSEFNMNADIILTSSSMHSDSMNGVAEKVNEFYDFTPISTLYATFMTRFIFTDQICHFDCCQFVGTNPGGASNIVPSEVRLQDWRHTSIPD